MYLHDNLFVCLLCYLLVSIGRSVNHPIAALSCCMTPAGEGSECARFKQILPTIQQVLYSSRGGSLLIAKPEQGP